MLIICNHFICRIDGISVSSHIHIRIKDIIKNILNDFVKYLDLSLDEQSWFNSLKALGEKYKFAPSGKIYKQNKDLYIGQVGDVAEMLRIALTTSKQSPNLYYILQILGSDEIARRINVVSKKI